MGRLGIRIANVALFTLCCFLVASVVNQISAELLLPARTAALAPARPAVLASRAWDDRQAILDRNLFDAKLTSEAAPPPPPPSDEPLEETKLPLKLLGTAASGDPKFARAAIEDQSSREHQVVRVDQEIEGYPQVRVEAIERRRLILDNRGRREELALSEEQLDLAARRPSPPDRTSRQTRSRRPRPSSRLADRLEQMRGARDAGRSGARSASVLFQGGTPMPKYENGEIVGMQLTDIKPGSFYEKLGFEDGDVITELNGIAMNSAAASAQILSQFTEAEEFNIVVRGPDGGSETRSIPAAEVEALFDE